MTIMRDIPWWEEDQEALSHIENALQKTDLLQALLAIEGADPSQEPLLRSLLQSWADRVVEICETDTSEAQIRALHAILVKEEDLRGDTEEYEHPHNSFLSHVVSRRRGLPILVSSIWILVGDRAGFRVEGVGLPGHFIVRVGGSDGLLADPFNEGRFLSKKDCRRLVARLSREQTAWEDRFLDPIDFHTLLERVLQNLLHTYTKRDEIAPLLRSIRLLRRLRPDRPSFPLMEARIIEQLGDISLAIEIYETLLLDFPTSHEAKQASKEIQILFRQSQMFN